MGRRSLEEKNIRKIMKIAGGKSYGITLPIDMVHDLRWRAGQKVEVRLSRNQIIIRDWESPKKEK